jgi:hypothetical protein
MARRVHLGFDPVGHQTSPVGVFIGYCHDSLQHCDQVLSLAQQLRRDGVDVWVDQFDQSLSSGLAGMSSSSASSSIANIFLVWKSSARGRGVKWEAKVIQNILYYEEINTGFIPFISMIRTAVLFLRRSEKHHAREGARISFILGRLGKGPQVIVPIACAR